MQIDLRFPARPDKIKVPLYPFLYNFDLKSMLYNYQEGMLSKKISEFFQVNLNQIILGNSATEVFLLFLLTLLKIRKKITVALPAFFCPHFAFSIAKCGGNIFFFEINNEFNISERSINRIIEEKCDVVVYPSYFGVRNISKVVQQVFVDRSIIVVLDQAQSFPLYMKDNVVYNNIISLFSFGKNKPLAGIGGGGMCFHDTKLLSDFLLLKENNFILEDFFKLFKTKALNFFLQRSKFLYEYFYRTEKRLDIFLEKYFKSLSDTQSLKKISLMQEKIAYYNWELLKKNTLIQRNRFNVLFSICKNYSINITQFLENLISFPSVFAIYIKNRHEFSKLLANNGVETTWYYYPLNYLSVFKQFDADQIVFTKIVSANILILPFQIHQSDQEFSLLCSSLRTALCL